MVALDTNGRVHVGKSAANRFFWLALTMKTVESAGRGVVQRRWCVAA